MAEGSHRREGRLPPKIKGKEIIGGISREQESERLDRAFEELDRYVTLAIETGEWGPCYEYMPRLKKEVGDLAMSTRNFKKFATHARENIKAIIRVEDKKDFDYSLRQELEALGRSLTVH